MNIECDLWPGNVASEQHIFKTTCPDGQVKFELTSTNKEVDANFNLHTV